MRISAKGRYALAAMIHMASQTAKEPITVISISTRLGISKIYLEQVFSLLKQNGLVISVKGAQGGYQLTRMPQQITVLDILSAVEHALLEPVEETVKENAPAMDTAMRLSAFEPLDTAVRESLGSILLSDLVMETRKQEKNQVNMYYI